MYLMEISNTTYDANLKVNISELNSKGMLFVRIFTDKDIATYKILTENHFQ
jgi:hypothetical protein